MGGQGGAGRHEGPPRARLEAMQEDDLALVQHAEIDRLAAGLSEALQDRLGAGHHIPRAGIAGADRERRAADEPPAAGALEANEAAILEGGKQPMGGGGGKIRFGGELRKRDARAGHR